MQPSVLFRKVHEVLEAVVHMSIDPVFSELVAMASVVVHVDANESVHDSLRVRQRQLCVLPQHTVAHPVHEERDVLRRAHFLLLAIRPHGPDVPVDVRLAAGLLRA